MRTLNNEIVLAMCGSAFKNKGVQAVLDAVIEFLPAPNEVAAIQGVLPGEEEKLILGLLQMKNHSQP